MQSLGDFIGSFKSLTLSTIDEKGEPFASYAPFCRFGGNYYIFISDIARHAKNLQARPKAAIFFIEDEAKASNIFARKRAVLQCKSKKLERSDAKFEAVMAEFDGRFDPEMTRMLLRMMDFNLYELTPHAGEAVFGFGETYDIGGSEMDELIPRRGGGHMKEVK